MSNIKSVHQKIEKVRKPRVHITYDVETQGAQARKELPFVVGVMGDFSADNKTALKPLKERKFTQIDPDNFDDVLAKNAPKLQFKVENTLKEDNSELAVELNFKSIEDFEPANIARQIEPLNKLLDIRTQLSDLLSKADRSDSLEKILEDILQNSDELKSLAKELETQKEGK